jgi:triosephosphate isomerase
VKKNLFETNKIINKKILTLLENNMTVVFCIGETLKDFEKNQTIATLKKQINECLKNINKNDIKNLIISYEPI